MRLAQYVKFREEKFGARRSSRRAPRRSTRSIRPPRRSSASSTAGRDEREIVSILKERFRDADGAVEREVVAFIADLRQKGLLDGTAP